MAFTVTPTNTTSNGAEGASTTTSKAPDNRDRATALLNKELGKEPAESAPSQTKQEPPKGEPEPPKGESGKLARALADLQKSEASRAKEKQRAQELEELVAKAKADPVAALSLAGMTPLQLAELMRDGKIGPQEDGKDPKVSELERQVQELLKDKETAQSRWPDTREPRSDSTPRSHRDIQARSSRSTR